MKWLTALRLHYTAPLTKSFKQFRLGLGLFFLGLVLIYIAHQLWPPSLAQESITLAGLVLVGVGFLLAMLAQMRMVISRILVFFLK